jgi:two-component system OmpR family response regulator
MIEDNLNLAELLTEFLHKYQIEITNYDTPELGLSALNLKPYDLVILDLSLPNIDGTEVCKEIRQTSDIPIIISTARADILEKTICFNLGADDFLPKPYDPQELLLRIQALLRRSQQSNPKQNKPQPTFTLSREKHEIKQNGTTIFFTNAEFQLLAYLIDKEGAVISREEILYNVEAFDYESTLKSIDVIVGRIRAKIEANPKQPKYLLAIRGQGYKLVH